MLDNNIWPRHQHVCYLIVMDDDALHIPPHEWLQSMDRSDADLAAGRIVPASVIHAELDATIAELDAAEVAEEDKAEDRRAVPHQP